MLPPKSRSANAQVYMMEKLLRQMVTLTGIEVIPTYQRHKRWACSSLSKLGFHAPAGGIPRRPEIQKCQETMALVRSYLKDCGKEGSLCQPFKPPNIQPSIQHVICEELSPKSRFNAAERTRKRRRWIHQSDRLVISYFHCGSNHRPFGILFLVQVLLFDCKVLIPVRIWQGMSHIGSEDRIVRGKL